MRWRTALVATTIALLLDRSSLAAPGDPAGAAQQPLASEPAAPSPKRPIPDYDGRGRPPTTPGEAALWVPRVLLSPAYLVTEYAVRRPLSVAIPAAERADLPRKVYDFFTFGPEHKGGVVPALFVEFNFNPSVGVYAFWDDAGFPGNHLRLHAEAWPTEWVGGSLTQRIVLDSARTWQLRLSGVRRPDLVFYGTGPSSVQSSQSRYGEDLVEASALYDWRFWRSSRIQTGLGVRYRNVYDGHYAGDPALTQEAATGAFSIPDGFGQAYTAVYDRVVAVLDTRVPAARLGSGARLELAAEQGSDVGRSPASGWIRYGATAAGYVDITGRARVLGLSVTVLFTDPLGSRPVPFPELAYLGGDHPMPGYFAGRLMDRSAAVATASYSWPVAPWLDGHVEVGAGNVLGTRLAELDRGRLRFSAALGLSLAGPWDAPLELLVGLGTETVSQGAKIDAARVMLGVPHTF
jgi:hypothetical protein